MGEKYFFDRDMDGHWYLVPEAKSALWREMSLNDPETEEEIDRFNESFEGHRIDSPSSHWVIVVGER